MDLGRVEHEQQDCHRAGQPRVVFLDHDPPPVANEIAFEPRRVYGVNPQNRVGQNNHEISDQRDRQRNPDNQHRPFNVQLSHQRKGGPQNEGRQHDPAQSDGGFERPNKA